jgi:hypothetical protein
MLWDLLPGGPDSFATVPLSPLAGRDMSSAPLHVLRFQGKLRVEIQSEWSSIHRIDLTVNGVYFYQTSYS